MAFFSIDETSGELLVGENFVLNAGYELYADRHRAYDLPVDGWYWFDTEDEARDFFGLPAAEDPHRQQLRDLPERTLDPKRPVWPQPPV